MPIKLLIPVIIAVLWYLGGQINHFIRRIPIPIILALYCAITLKWWLFFTVGACYGLTIPIGYGEPTPDDNNPSWLGKIFRIGWLIRGTYGFLVSGIGSISLVLGRFIPLPLYIVYVITNFAVGAILCKIKAPAIIIEPMVGIFIGSVILYI